MTDKLLRAGVIGLGAMGRHHVRIYNQLDSVELVGVSDVDPGTLKKISSEYGITPYSDVSSILRGARLDIVSIVAPTSLHCALACQALEAGVNVLVEKPIASTMDESRQMISTAERVGKSVMVGHIERFNPAVLELKKRLSQAGTIYSINARRIGLFPERIRDVGVVTDLGTHDIDAMLYLTGSRVVRAQGVVAQRIHTSQEDLVLANLQFESGVVGSLDINWLSPRKIRELSVLGSHGAFNCDYLEQQLTFYENGSISDEWDDFQDPRLIAEGNATSYNLQKREPLMAELSYFVSSVQNGQSLRDSAVNAANALSVATSIIESAKTGTPVVPEQL